MMGTPISHPPLGDPDMMNAPARRSRAVPVVLLIVGLLLIVAAVVYFTTAADKLPSFFPGHAAGVTKTHTKHGIASGLLGVVALAGAWMTLGAKADASVR
jgi:hypothetical protein